MKKILGLLFALLLVTGCDDGNMTLQSFSFSGGLTLCNESTNTYLSINTSTKEVLVITLPSAALLNKLTLDSSGNPEAQTYTLSSGAIEYRVYSATPTQSNLCSGVDNGTLNIVERWIGSGTISIVTTKVESTTASDEIAYDHSVTLTDVSFTKGDQTIRILDNYLGSTQTTTGFGFDFTASGTALSTLDACADGRLFLPVGEKALLLNLPSGTFTNQARTQTFDTDDTHQIRMRLYNGSSLDNSVICNGALSPVLEQEWSTTTNTGGGNIKIISTESVDTPGTYIHKIYLYNSTRFYNLLNNGEYFIPIDNDTDPDTSEGRYYIGFYTTN